MTARRKTTVSARRYWFADTETLIALETVIDPPAWPVFVTPLVLFALDSGALQKANDLAIQHRNMQVVDVSDPANFDTSVRSIIAREDADYIQIARHAVADFLPALGLVLTDSGPGEPGVLSLAMMKIGEAETKFDDTAKPQLESGWIGSARLREHLPDTIGSVEAMCDAARAIIVSEARHFPIIGGAWFAPSDPHAPPSQASIERAKLAVEFAGKDRAVYRKRLEKHRAKPGVSETFDWDSPPNRALGVAIGATQSGFWQRAIGLWRDQLARKEMQLLAAHCIAEAAIKSGRYDLAVHMMAAADTQPSSISDAFAASEGLREQRTAWFAAYPSGIPDHCDLEVVQKLLALGLYREALRAISKVASNAGETGGLMIRALASLGEHDRVIAVAEKLGQSDGQLAVGSAERCEALATPIADHISIFIADHACGGILAQIMRADGDGA